jgi:hypothetical protein
MANKVSPTIVDLHDPTRYRRFAVIPHAEVAAAIRPYLYQWTLVTAIYWAFNVASLLWLVVAWGMSGEGVMAGFSTASLGMVGGYLLLLPIHEALHALAYRLIGARGWTLSHL